MTKICCKNTATSWPVKSPLMGILAGSLHNMLGLMMPLSNFVLFLF